MKKYILLLIFSCSSLIVYLYYSINEGNDQLITEISELCPKDPKEALKRINGLKTIQYEFANEDFRNKLYILELMSKDKSGLSIKNDTLVFKMGAYFNKTNNPKFEALSMFYSGRIFEYQKKPKNALGKFLEAERIFMENTQIKGSDMHGVVSSTLARMYNKQVLPKKSSKYSKFAASCFLRSGNMTNYCRTLQAIAGSNLLQSKVDSALVNLNRALNIALDNNLTKLHSPLYQYIGLVYKEGKNLDEAVKYLRLAQNSVTDSLDKQRLYLTLADTYRLNKKMKESREMLELIDTVNIRLDIKALKYQYFSRLDADEGNFEKALTNHKSYSLNLIRHLRNSNAETIVKLEDAVDMQRVQNENQKLLNEKQQFQILILLVFLLISILVIYLFRLKALRSKEHAESQQKYIELQELVSNYKKRDGTYKNILVEHFQMIKKTALLKGYLCDNEINKSQKLLNKFNRTLYRTEEVEWKQIIEEFDSVSHGYFSHIRTKLHELTEVEYIICCLLLTDFTNSQIAIILNYKTATIEVKKSKIRNILNLPSRCNIKTYITELCPPPIDNMV